MRKSMQPPHGESQAHACACAANFLHLLLALTYSWYPPRRPINFLPSSLARHIQELRVEL